MKKTAIFALTILLTACAGLGGGPAQNRDQFVQGMQKYGINNNDDFVAQSTTINRNIHQIAKTLQARIDCYNFHIEREFTTVNRSFGNTHYGKDKQILDYSGSIQKSGNGYELTIQRDDNSPGYVKNQPWPKGGIYILAIDYTPLGANKTQMTIYQMPKVSGMDRWQVIRKPIVDWSMGKNTQCPDFRTEKLI